ncbi:MAG TPA: trypsin-like serine protease, partial [Allocoleopsis sp.]
MANSYNGTLKGNASTSLPVSMARQDSILDLFSTNYFALSSKSHSSASSLSTGRPIASRSVRTASALIFPPDQRVPVAQPSYPFSAVGQMISRWKGTDGMLNTGDDIVLSSSGAMVSKFHFLTAGHSVYQKKFGGWAAQVEVQLPGGRTAFKTSLRSYSGWTRNQDFRYDLGLVTLDRNIGNQTSWFGYGYNNAIRSGTLFYSTGYPSDKADANGDGIRDNFNVWTQVGTITQTTDLTLRSTDLDLATGASGGPLWLQTKSGPIIYGVTSN